MEKAKVQNALAALLLITASIIITSIVVTYAVNVVQVTLQTSNIPQLDRLKAIQDSILNQTNNLQNQTSPFNDDQIGP
jgi:hypothetical protein